jgi:anaerobic magnesium-protoporphyrin IX monomethyl ester cyclase
MLIRLVALNARFVHSSPALFYLRNLLAENLPDGELELCQFTINDPYYDTLLRLAQGSPAAIFFSVYVWNAAYVRRLILDLAQIRPDLALVAGGPQAAHLELPAPVKLTVAQGPAEGLGPDFYGDLVQGRLGSLYRAAAAAPFVMPYRPEDCRGELRHRHIYYESSRGCPFACSYCLSATRRGVAYRDLAAVLAELELLLSCRPPVIRFVDRTFNAPPERALAIWRFLARRGGDTRFHFEIAPDLFDEAGLAFLATVPPGLFQFEIGLQSFNPASLAAVNRNPDLAKARANIRRLAAAGNIHLHLDLILGLPFETAASYRHSLNEILALRPHHLQLGLLKVLPDTPLAQRREEFALRCCQEPPYPVLATRWLAQPDLAELYLLGELIEAYYNPRYFLATLAYIMDRETDPAAFFTALAATAGEHGFAGRARTQELLSTILAHHWRRRPDGELGLELLRFDWLACGHRRLPDHLVPAGVGDELKTAQDRLWRALPDHYPPLFSPQSRSGFFKRSVFAPFSAAALNQLGMGPGDQPGIVAFLAESTGGLKPRQATVFFPSPDR